MGITGRGNLQKYNSVYRRVLHDCKGSVAKFGRALWTIGLPCLCKL